jgi:hypothetical protein
MVLLLSGEADQRVYCDCAESGWANDNWVDVELDEGVQVGFCVVRAREDCVDESRDVTCWFAAEAV